MEGGREGGGEREREREGEREEQLASTGVYDIHISIHDRSIKSLKQLVYGASTMSTFTWCTFTGPIQWLECQMSAHTTAKTYL